MHEMLETWVRTLNWEDPLEEGMETHSSILSWIVSWTEEPGGLRSMRSQRDGHSWSDLACTHSAAAAAKSLQSCPTLCDPIDGSPLDSPVPEILQERTLEWVAISFSNAWKWKVKVTLLSRVRLLATPWTAAYQAPPSMDFPGKSTGVGYNCLLPMRNARLDESQVGIKISRRNIYNLRYADDTTLLAESE